MRIRAICTHADTVGQVPFKVSTALRARRVGGKRSILIGVEFGIGVCSVRRKAGENALQQDELFGVHGYKFSACVR